jgi:heme/copper-type cytochrome/quinol oxidase subunit 3
MEAHGAREPYLEPEPVTWQPRVMWAGARLLAGAVTFFFISFVFAFFYLKSLDLNKNWKIGHVKPSIGLGVAIIVCLVLSAVLLRVAARRPIADFAASGLPLAAAALVLALVSVALQCVEYTVQKFGPASGGYASVYTGWTAFYSVFTLGCIYWITTQVTSLWRRRREGAQWAAHAHLPTGELELTAAGLESCSFFWGYFVLFGFVEFVLLYLIR